LDGSPLFTFAQLLKYRAGEYQPSIDKISDPYIRDMVLSMISLEPNDRLTAAEYLVKWNQTIFPDYFPYMHQYLLEFSTFKLDAPIFFGTAEQDVRLADSDLKIDKLYQNMHKISKRIFSQKDGNAFDANVKGLLAFSVNIPNMPNNAALLVCDKNPDCICY
jgi:phosphoinositide-3-kinase regulatory subunit 4